VLTYALAVLAACANAVSSVLQRKANKRVPQSENMSLRQIRLLLRQPVWFGGIAAIRRVPAAGQRARQRAARRGRARLGA
jgi:hypothetical protein